MLHCECTRVYLLRTGMHHAHANMPRLSLRVTQGNYTWSRSSQGLLTLPYPQRSDSTWGSRSQVYHTIPNRKHKTHAHTQTHIHTHIQTHTHTHIHIHTHTRTHTRTVLTITYVHLACKLTYLQREKTNAKGRRGQENRGLGGGGWITLNLHGNNAQSLWEED